MDAVLATIVDDGQAIHKITWVAVEIPYYTPFLIISHKTKPKRSCPTPSKEVVYIRLDRSIDPMPSEGKTAPPWWWYLCDSCVGVWWHFPYYSYHRNPMGWEVFVPAAISINLDIIALFRLHKWPRTPNLSQEGWVKLCKADTICLWTAYQCAQTLCKYLIWTWEAVWGGYQPQPWHNDIILTSQVIQNPKIQTK
jgi:hypothetical protein